MWIPKTVDEIERIIPTGSVKETETFDAKKQLPDKSKNNDIAKDVAAMANDGGVLLYGVGEDANGQPTVLSPIPLAGASERITSIVQTSIAEPPAIIVSEFPRAQNPAEGYILVVIPPSPRAPHMVISGEDYRYYERKGKINMPMGQGDVARLYQRRSQWERDVRMLLAAEIERAPLKPHPDFGYLHLFAWPVSSTSTLLVKAHSDGQNAQTLLDQLAQLASEPSMFPGSNSPDFSYGRRWQRQTDGWKTYMQNDPQYRPDRTPEDVLDLQVNFDGSGWLFCGYVAERRGQHDNEPGQLFLMEDLVARLTTRFAYYMGKLYERAGYVGQVDLAVVVTNLEGATSLKLRDTRSFYRNPPPYIQPNYQNTTRTSALSMGSNAKSVAQELVGPLIDTVTQERHNPFA